jgi:hypothetical protein
MCHPPKPPSRRVRPVGSTQAAAGQQFFAGEPTRVVGCHEGHHVGDVLRLAEPAERGLGDDAGFE